MKNKPMQHAPAAASGGLKLSSDYRNDPFEYWPRPSELELAQLAARLARTETIDPKQLVGEAWALYRESCRVIREDHKHVTEYLENEGMWEDVPDNEVGRPAPSLPVPKKYPVHYKEAELLLLPGLKGRTADRARVMRDFLFVEYVCRELAAMTPSGGKPIISPTGELLERLREQFRERSPELFAELRRKTFDQGRFAEFAEKFLSWYWRREWIIKSMVRSDSARRSWLKRRQEKTAQTGARSKFGALRPVLEQSPLDRSISKKKS